MILPVCSVSLPQSLLLPTPNPGSCGCKHKPARHGACHSAGFGHHDFAESHCGRASEAAAYFCAVSRVNRAPAEFAIPRPAQTVSRHRIQVAALPQLPYEQADVGPRQSISVRRVPPAVALARRLPRCRLVQTVEAPRRPPHQEGASRPCSRGLPVRRAGFELKAAGAYNQASLPT